MLCFLAPVPHTVQAHLLLSCPSPGIGHFPKKPLFLQWRMDFRNEAVGPALRIAVGEWLPVPLRGQAQEACAL